MIGILAAVVVVLGVLAGADLLLSFAVIRRLAALEARGALPGAGGGLAPAVGYQIGEFRVSLLTGGEFSRADLAGVGAIVVFISPSCEPCKAAVDDMRALPSPFPAPLYILVAETDQSGAAGRNAAALIDDLPGEARVGAILAADATTEAFAIDGFPTALAIEDGIVRGNELRVSRLLDLVSQ